MNWTGKAPIGLDELEQNARERYRLRGDDTLECPDTLRCCVRGCGTWLPPIPRTVQNRVYCEKHGIGMSSSPTYVYSDYRDNVIIGVELLNKVKKKKVETWRLVNERSEDAVSWNVFVSLARLQQLGAAFHLLTGLKPSAEPELYMWGNQIGQHPSQLWDRLCEVRRELENGFRIPTEPDIILRVPGIAIVLIEAKFGSGNGTLGGSQKLQRFGTTDSFLARYRPVKGRADPLARNWITRQAPAQVLEQLCRNVIFAQWLAGEGEQSWVVNLVREGKETEVTKAMACHLAPDSSVHFCRATWEAIYCCLPGLSIPDAAPLRRYMLNKTVGLQRAFQIAI